jgi:hypothetical protein
MRREYFKKMRQVVLRKGEEKRFEKGKRFEEKKVEE